MAIWKRACLLGLCSCFILVLSRLATNANDSSLGLARRVSSLSDATTTPPDHPRSFFNGPTTPTLYMVQPFFPSFYLFIFFFFFFYLNGQHESTGRHTRVAREVTSTLSAGRRCNNARIGLGPLRADCSARGTPAGRLANAPGPRSCRETTVTAARAIAWTRRAIVHGVSGRSRGLQGRKTYWCVSRHSCSNLGCLLGIAFSTLYSCFTFGEARD